MRSEWRDCNTVLKHDVGFFLVCDSHTVMTDSDLV